MKTLNQPQTEVIDRGLLAIPYSWVLHWPTGSGKTYLAELAIAQALEQGQKVIYLCPLKALAAELGKRWSGLFPDHKVGIFNSDTETNHVVSYSEAHLLICTYERLDAITRNWYRHWGWLPELSVLVCDELHLIGDPGRGSRLEGALCRIQRLNPFVRVLALSATLGNPAELADWLQGVYHVSTWRPVPLQWRKRTFKKAADKPDHAIEEVRRNKAGNGRSLVFVQSRRRTEQLAEAMEESGLRAGYHHAGLSPTERHRVEQQLMRGELDVLVATTTLAMGVNLPVNLVLLYDTQTFSDGDWLPLSVNTAWQLAGRAGRPGYQDDKAEVVLLEWCREQNSLAREYPKGRFEPIRSTLSSPRLLAEQIIAEVGSGLCRSIPQLQAAFAVTLAAKQDRLPDVEFVTEQMIEEREAHGSSRLYVTPLGRVAVRHLLYPQTVLLLKQVLERFESLTFLDLLILVLATEDAKPIIPCDFEALEDLCTALQQQPSVLLTLSRSELAELLGKDGKNLLSVLNTAMIARQWTQLGTAADVADARGCYEFEVELLQENVSRLLQAMTEVVKILETNAKMESENSAIVPVSQRLKALTAMVAAGLDEDGATLTLVKGVGPAYARLLRLQGINDIEDLSLSDAATLSSAKGLSPARAEQWIAEASLLLESASAFYFREDIPPAQIEAVSWPPHLDPYRLRRSLSLMCEPIDEHHYRVWGGLEPHQVYLGVDGQHCDCRDREKGNLCKHLLAAELKRGDRQLQHLVEVLLSQGKQDGAINLASLWVDARPTAKR